MQRMFIAKFVTWRGPFVLCLVVAGCLTNMAEAGGYVYRARSYYVAPPAIGLYSPLFYPPPIFVYEQPFAPAYFPPTVAYRPAPMYQPAPVYQPGPAYQPEPTYQPGSDYRPGSAYQPAGPTPAGTDANGYYQPGVTAPPTPGASLAVPSNSVPTVAIPPAPIGYIPRTAGYLAPPPVAVAVGPRRVVETWRTTPYRSVYRYRVVAPVPYRVWQPGFLSYGPVVW